MRVLTAIGNFLADNQTLIAALIPVVFAFIRTTKWGNANKDALTKVAEAIESIGDPALKADITAKFETASPGSKAAMDRVVTIVDSKKTPLPVFEVILKDLALVLMPKPKGTK